jgi:hypothetical protein
MSINLDAENPTKNDLIELLKALDWKRVKDDGKYEEWGCADFHFHTRHVTVPTDSSVPYYQVKLQNAKCFLIDLYGRNHLKKYLELLRS